MKKLIALALTAGLVAGAMAMPADAAKKKKKKVVKVTREATGTYQAPTPIAAGLCGQADAVGCVTIPAALGEKYVTAKVTDSHGQPVAVAVKADLDGNGNTEVLYGTFCGETTEPILIDEGATVTFWVGISPDTAALGCAPGTGTQGTVTATFSNLP